MNKPKKNPASRFTLANLSKAALPGALLTFGFGSSLFGQAQSGLKVPGKLLHPNKGNRGAFKARIHDALKGNAGNDLMLRAIPGCIEAGTPAVDTLYAGGTYCDTAFGYAADDVIMGYSYGDTLVLDGGADLDKVSAYSYGPVFAFGGTESDSIQVQSLGLAYGNGNEGDDVVATFSYNGLGAGIGGAGNDQILPRSYYGDIYANGEAGEDYIYGVSYYGDAYMLGGLNNDDIIGGSYGGDSFMDGNEGDDNLLGLSVMGNSNVVFGGSGNDLIFGLNANSAGTNHLDGGTENDVLVVGMYQSYGYTYPTYLYYGANLNGGAGNDILYGHASADTLISGTGLDELFAYGGDDRLYVGDDIFITADGGPGTDVLLADFDLDVSSLTSMFNLERIDVSGSGPNIFTSIGSNIQLATTGVNPLTSTTKTMVIDGGSDDSAVLDGGWTLTGTGTIGPDSYEIYEYTDGTRLWIHFDMNVVSTGTDQASLSGSFSVSPSPAQDEVQVSFTAPSAGEVVLNVTDLTGKTVLTETREVPAGMFRNKLDISRLSSGVYMVHIRMAGASVARKLVVE